MIAFPLFALALGALLHDKAAQPAGRCDVRVRRARVAVAASLDRGFVSEVYDACSPSVALVLPRGVRNTTAQGSGFVVAIDGDNYILTSAHVAAGGTTVGVALPADGFAARHGAHVVGRAPGGEDLAILALDDAEVAAGLTPLEFGDPGALRPGSFVIALGHPSGILGAVTLGVLSGRVELPAFDSAAGSATRNDGDGKEDDVAASAMVPFLVTDAAFAGGM